MADLASRITKPDEAPAAPENDEYDEWQAEKNTTTDEKIGSGHLDGADDDNAPDGSAYDIEVQLADVDGSTNELYSAKTFEDLNLDPKIMLGLHAMDFKKPSKIQERALPLMMTDPPMNMIAQSQSGTGKTAAFSLAILSRIDTNKSTQPQALVLAPSRELVRQIQGVIQAIGQFMPDLVVEAAIPGGISREHGIRASVVVGTPGTVMDSIRRRHFDPSQLRMFVVDEADNMLDQQGLGDQCLRTKGMLPSKIQVLLFSATFPEKVMQFAEKFAPNASQLKLRHNEQTVKGISQMYMDCPTRDAKYDVLCKLYGLMTIGSSVIFVKTRESAEEIKRRMETDGHKVSVLHGAYEGLNRDQVLDEFRLGNSKVLITTNVLARGIDVSSVSMVINYDVPMKGPPRNEEPDPETYYHRIGRTGRFGRVGVSITFIADGRDFDALTEITQYYGIELVQLSPDSWDDTEKKVQNVIKSSRARAEYAPAKEHASGKDKA